MSNVKRPTLADADENRDWRIYTEFAQLVIQELYIILQVLSIGIFFIDQLFRNEKYNNKTTDRYNPLKIFNL